MGKKRLKETLVKNAHAALCWRQPRVRCSVIPAFAKKEDLIFADQGVNFSIKTGLELSKSKCVFFRHNDVNDLAVRSQQPSEQRH
eukprot:SAG31_NODE_918_length_11020_cov_14.801392_8_plen_85_part_00